MMAAPPSEVDLGDKMVETLGLQYIAKKETASNDEDWLSEEDEVASGSRITARGCTFAERRHLPSRASKESSCLSIKRRTIMKPAKHTSSIHKDIGNLKPSQIKKIYMNKKLTKFRPTSLETIFEEPPANNQTTSLRKLRRTLCCTDGFVYNNKALVKKRRAKIMKTFGRRLSLKKITLEDFLEKLNNSMEGADSTDQNEEMTPATVAATAQVVINMPDHPLPTEDINESCCSPIQTTLSTTDSILNFSSKAINNTEAFISEPAVVMPSDDMEQDCCSPIQIIAETNSTSSPLVVSTTGASPLLFTHDSLQK